MNSHHKMQTVFGIILRNWTVLLCFEIVYKIIGISFLFPFFEYSLSLLPRKLSEPGKHPKAPLQPSGCSADYRHMPASWSIHLL